MIEPRDDAGQPIDYERYQRLLAREEREAEREASVSIRTVPTLGEGVIELAAVGRDSKIIVRLSLPAGSATIDDERWLLERARRLLPSPEKPDIRLVG